jgi:hypothetical protein
MLILLAAAGLVAAALVGAAVAVIVANFLVYPRRFPPVAGPRDETPTGALTPTRPAPLHAAGLMTSPIPAPSPDEAVPPSPDFRVREAGSLASTLPEAPWDYAARPPAPRTVQDAGPAASSLPETPWKPPATPQESSTFGDAESAAFTLPEGPWDHERVGPATSSPVPETEPAVSNLQETPWGGPPQASSEPGWDETASVGVGSNGVRAHSQQETHDFPDGDIAAPGGSNISGRWDSSSPAVEGWGDLSPEAGAEDHTGGGSSSSPEPPHRPPPDDEPPLWKRSS